ncbi:GAF domain-containing protein [Calothrix sp. FACHB-1219]|uniref:GAF domain-containing protein n=1 Tax=unclassified Calothrix TaxID=2619626 RepID=UPI0016886A35|nr:MULTISPECIES: GAF domain-containing protein [unclassified Calothrix]MBD2204112.1 GAF domain-containing protein [Calothrix sp. FACHB-168]MBD2220926.1 GAF domain-containing protein [Calothrix sp. FACHB-1219]
MFNSTNSLIPLELKSAIVRDPIIVKLDTLVIDAIAQMSSVRAVCDTTKIDELHLDARSSCVLVVDDGRLVGILTERDVVRLCAQQRHLENLRIGDVMIHPVIALEESEFTDFFFAVNLLQQYHIRHLPILDEQGQVVGLLTNESLRQSSSFTNILRLRLACEVMTREVICAAPDSSLLAIAQLMTANRVSSVIIVEPGGNPDKTVNIPVGIVTEGDIVQFQSLGLNLANHTAQTVMSTPIFTVKPDDSLWTIQQIVEQRLIRRLVVTGVEGELLGIVTQTTLLQALNPLELYKLAEFLEKKVVQLETEKVQLLEARNVELEQQVAARTNALNKKVEQAQLVSDIAMQIRSSLSLQTILDTTVAQVRQLLNCDRVTILRLEADGKAIVVAESTNSSLSVLGERVEDTCFQQDYQELYRQGRIRVVSDIYQMEMAECHREMLQNLQIRAKILVPLLCDDQLWGLLNVTESHEPREWQQSEIELIEALSVHLEIALHQATTHQKLQEELSDRQQAELTLQKLVNGTAAVTGDDFFHALVRHIAEALDVPYAIVSELVDNKLHTLGFWANRTLEPEIIYDPNCTPCESSLKYGEFYCDNQVQTSFPDDLDLVRMQAESYVGIALKDDLGKIIGNLCILHRQPLSQTKRNQAIAILQVFAARAAAELQRQAATEALHRLNQDLEIRVEQRTQEIQARKAELRRISDRLSLALKSGAIGCWEWDIAENTILWDERMHELYGIAPQPDSCLTYEVWANRLHSDDRNSTENLIQQAVLGQAEYDTEFRVVHFDNSIHYIKATGVVVRDEQGNPQKMIGVHFDISDRKRAELALQSSEMRFRRIFDSHVVGMIFADFQGRVIDTNEHFLEMVGYTREELNAGAMNWHAMTPPEHVPADFAAMEHLMQHGEIDPWEKEYYRKDGSRIPVLLGAALLPDSENQTICVVVDMSKQKAALQEREKAEKRLQQQARHKQLLWNITQTIRQSLDIHEILATVTQQVKDVMQCDRVIVFRLFADGRSQIAEEAVAAEFPSLKNLGWQNEVWSQEILDCYWKGKPRIVPDVMDDIWTHCLVEYSREGQIQSKVVAPILQEVRNQNHRWVAPWSNNKLWGILVIHACQEKRVWKDSEAQLLQQIANQVAIAIQQASLFEQLQQELAERQQAETKLTEANQQLAFSNQELARATRLKDEFLANMSHELRTPLNAILGMTEGLQDAVFGTINEQQRKALQTIERSGSHLLELINDILDVAKIEAGQIELDCTSVSVASLCQSSLAFIKQQALQKRIQLEIKLQPKLPELLVDERRIRQVLINLLNNAVKFTPTGGQITLEVNKIASEITASNTEENFLQIAVRDTGIGISAADINKLFKPFIQIDTALNRQYVGTGLGLALVKRIVELHGGRVGLTSELGVGSCFTIELPYNPASCFSANLQPRTTLELDSATADPGVSLAPTILLVEDNEANISTVSSYLSAKGYCIILAYNGQEAIDQAKMHQPDLILMDIQMPGMDGLEAIAKIRQDPQLLETPIVALTALTMAGDRDRCLEAGANDYLSKPVKLKQLSTTIQQLLTHHK